MRHALAIADRLGQIWRHYLLAALAAGVAAVIVAAFGALVGQPAVLSLSFGPLSLSLGPVAAIIGVIGLFIAALVITKFVNETTMRHLKALTRRGVRDDHG
jgi:phage-related protein